MIRYIFLIITVLRFNLFDVFAQTEFSVCLYDNQRSRPIPVTIYKPSVISDNTKPVIFNHGYDGNKNINSNETYAYLTRFLSAQGYYVISIQHDLPNDELLSMQEPFMSSRMPFWKKGEANILFTISEFKKLIPDMDWESLILIGHSNGGDMVMLTATEYPSIANRVISLDNRRMIIPRTGHPQIMTLRGCDYPADNGVLPTKEEQDRYNIRVVYLDGISHSDMGENGTKMQHDRINQYIELFISKQE